MRFIQLIVAENDATPSGASIRNKSNFEILSTLGLSKGGGQVIPLRVDNKNGLKSGTSIVASLNLEDIKGLIAECRRMPPDFILVEGVVLFQAVAALTAALPDVAIILDMHNIESHLRAQTDRQKLPLLLRFMAPLIFRRNWCNGLRAEREIIAIARQIWVCSDADAFLADSFFGQIPFAVVPNPIPEWTQTAIRSQDVTRQDVLFVGHLGYAPNKRAVAFLCKKVMPKLRRLLPDARLHVCGRLPRRRIAMLVQARGHRLSPNAQNMAEVYATAALVAIPLRDGGGTRLKVLEAMAIGCPVVATRKAVEGLEVMPQIHYHAAESAVEFAQHIAGVLAAPELAAEMAQQAQVFITKRYGMESRLAAVRAALIAGGPRFGVQN